MIIALYLTVVYLLAGALLKEIVKDEPRVDTGPLFVPLWPIFVLHSMTEAGGELVDETIELANIARERWKNEG